MVPCSGPTRCQRLRHGDTSAFPALLFLSFSPSPPLLLYRALTEPAPQIRPIAEYVVDGSRIVLDDAVISFFRVLYPKPSQPYATSTLSASLSSSPIPIPNPQSLHLLDPSGAFIIEAALAAPDGAGPDVLAAAGQRLLALRERLRHVVRLEPGERLAMDVRVK